MPEFNVEFVHSDSEIARFIENYKLIIYSGCKNARLARCHWDIVLNEMAFRFATGKLECDPARVAKYTRFIAIVAGNCARDVKREQRKDIFQNLEDKEWDDIASSHGFHCQTAKEDIQFVIRESLKRLAEECRDKKKIQILVRYILNKESRESLAEEYGVDEDYVSVVKNRWYDIWKILIRRVIRDDYDGALKLSKTDISSLEKFLKNW